MASTPVLTICGRYCHILHFKAGLGLTLQKFWTYYLLPIISEILAEPIFSASSIIRTSHVSALSCNRYMLWVKLMSLQCAEVSDWPDTARYQKMLEFPPFDSYSAHKLRSPVDMKLVDSSSNMIRIYPLTVYLWNFRMGCCTTIKHCTALHLLSV